MNCALVVICALPNEAEPIIRRYGMVECMGHFDRRLSLKFFLSLENPLIGLVLFGTCSYSGVNKIGMQIASLAAWETIRTLEPRILVNCGTAGGFRSKGSQIGDVFLSEGNIYFHGRHIPVPGYQQFELGAYPVTFIPSPTHIKRGVVSSSDSVPATELDLGRMRELGTDAKDMEAAAIAEVAFMTHVPFVALKSITDYVDSNESTYAQFKYNFAIAIEKLVIAFESLLPNLLHFISQASVDASTKGSQ